MAQQGSRNVFGSPHRLTIITCTIRPDGAIKAARSIQAANPHPFDLRHVIAYWAGEPDHTRERVAPWLTDLVADVSDGWLLFIDDDNRLHPGLLARLSTLIEAHPDARAFVFDCLYPGMYEDRLRAGPTRMRPCQVDGGQLVLHASIAKSVAIAPHGCYDGVYAQVLYQRHVDAFIFVNEALTYHNHQVWGNTSTTKHLTSAVSIV